jgi:N-acetylmuramoyl-L-alanine amidase
MRCLFNPSEAALLSDTHFRTGIALSIAEGIANVSKAVP